MKTAMQDLLNSLYHQSNGCDGKERYILSGVIDFIKSELLEKEKQQIIDAWNEGVHIGYTNDPGSAEKYYDLTFKP